MIKLFRYENYEDISSHILYIKMIDILSSGGELLGIMDMMISSISRIEIKESIEVNE
jgi:hypothetical protein